MKQLPRVLIAAASSGSGKTMITCGILQALKNRKYEVVSFKCGPDYIDPMFHAKVIGTRARNLDTFFTEEDITRYLLMENAKDADISVMEGVMGYYDGVGGTTTQASAYELASITKTPVILIVNCKGMSVSMVAQIKGFLEYRSESRIQGVILNQISPMLYQRMKNLIEEELHIQVLGYVPVVVDCVLESRHLGLVLPEEVPQLQEKMQGLAGILEQTLNLDGILRLANSAPKLEPVDLKSVNPAFAYQTQEPVRIALASDEAFCFFYEDNLKLLRKMGTELIPFSPIHDKEVPRGVHGILLYGGYPELYGRELSSNHTMLESIYQKITEGMPCIAECGGFMYLHEKMEDMKNHHHKMVGIIPGEVYRTPKLKRFGYVTLTLGEEVFGQELGNLPAHEFHYFDSTNCGNDYLAKKPMSSRSWGCMHARENLFTGFPHFHYYGNPKLPAAFLNACVNYKKTRQKG